MPGSNKAIVCRQPHDLAQELRGPVVRGQHEARLKIARVGICGTDYHIFEGRQPFLEYPRVIGHELAARVVEAPDGSRFAEGELVVVNPYVACGRCHACLKGLPNACMRIGVLGVHRDGGMCEEICLPEENLIAAESLSPDEAASVEFLAIGAHAVRRSQLKSGERGLVVGAGPIGLGVALFAKIAGGDWSDETVEAVDAAVKQYAEDFGYDLDEEGQPLDEDQPERTQSTDKAPAAEGAQAA